MSNHEKEGSCANTNPQSQSPQNTSADIVAHIQSDVSPILMVTEAIKELTCAVENIDTSGVCDVASAINDLHIPCASTAIYAAADAIVDKLHNIACMIDLKASPEPVTPGGPNDWVITICTGDRPDKTKLQVINSYVVKQPVVYWSGVTPKTAPIKFSWQSLYPRQIDTLVLRNGVCVNGSGADEAEFVADWETRGTHCYAVVQAPKLPSDEDICMVVALCFDEIEEARGIENPQIPRCYKQYCEAFQAKPRLLQKLQRWGYTKEVHDNYVAQFYPEGSYWTVQDWENNLCTTSQIDTYKQVEVTA